MKKMSINDAAEHFGISKEAIHNRIRRGSLQSIIVNGIKMVVVDETQSKAGQKRATSTRNATVNNDRYYKLLQEQNDKLQKRVDTLEDETRTLRDQKEQMLIQEREKIERIYKEKDEQLKNILELVNAKMMLEHQHQTIHEVETVEKREYSPELVELKEYLKTLSLKSYQRKVIKRRFLSIYDNDSRILQKNGKLYLDFSKYDYNDLLSY